jgi:hypothetical protein
MVKLKKSNALNEALASKGDGLNRTACLCEATSILSPLMCIQWLILAPVVGYVIVQLTFPADEYLVVFDVILFVLLLIFIPVFLIAICVRWGEVKMPDERYVNHFVI